VSGRHTDAKQKIRTLQGFLTARGHRLPLSGVFCRRTVTAAQTYLRECVDRTVVVDGVRGPHTNRALQSAEREIERRSPPESSRGTRLVMHTSSRKKSDFYTFQAEAMRLEGEYKRSFPNDTIKRVLVNSGKDIAKAINACEPGSIVSWDVLSHSNAGGIHISTDLAQPKASSAQRQRNHVKYRSNSRNPQSAKDALFMEEDMRGMYTSRETTELVADYFNQQTTQFSNTLDAIDFSRFSQECYVELHGCRTVNDDAQEADLFIGNLSARLPCDAIVVGHTRGSYPQGQRGYRHGEVGVFRGGVEVHRGAREPLKLPNASTPGQGDEGLGSTPVRRTSGGDRRQPGRERDFKSDWPRDTPPRRTPPRTCEPPRTRQPPRTPPRGRDEENRNDRETERGRDDSNRNDRETERGRDNSNRNDRETERGRDNSNRNDRETERGRDQGRGQNQPGSQVPWGAILTGAAVVGGIAMQRRRERDRRRQDDNNSRPPQNPPNNRPQNPPNNRTPQRPAPRPAPRNDRPTRSSNPLGSVARGLSRFRR